MSYILEALKKSQQERELGHVPTLETPIFAPEGAVARLPYWGAAAIALAAMAVMIALYAALRGTPSNVEAQSPPAVVERTALSPDVASGDPTTQPPAASAVAPSRAAVSDSVSDLEDATSESTQPAEAFVEDTPIEPAPAPAKPAPRPRAQPKVAMQQDKGIRVPEDLREEIEAFKEQVRLERAGGKPPAPAPAEDVPPQELRLPRDVAKRMPAFLMTVHIYDEDPGKRFVYINSRKVREGQRTREDIVVEQILADGAVLSYDGHRFFQHR